MNILFVHRKQSNNVYLCAIDIEKRIQLLKALAKHSNGLVFILEYLDALSLYYIYDIMTLFSTNFTLLFLFLPPYVRYTYWQHNYEQYTELEAHAELCSAEALLLKALLTFIEDETLTSLIKGGIKIRTCFNSYKYVCIVYLCYKHKRNSIKKFNNFPNSFTENADIFWRNCNGNHQARKCISKVVFVWVLEHLI